MRTHKNHNIIHRAGNLLIPILILLLFCTTAMAADGDLDTTFGGDGLSAIADLSGGNNDYVSDIAIQPDEKIVVVGTVGYNTVMDVGIVRYNTDGSLDTSFSGDGIVTTDFGADEYGSSVAIQPDGKIIVGGQSGSYPNYESVMARYNSDGSLDTSFSGDGKVILTFGSSNHTGASVAVQPDGKIVFSCSYGAIHGAQDIAVARFNADGSLDTSFSGDGKVTTDINGGSDVSRNVAIQSDGKIVVSGDSGSPSAYDFAVVRYNTDGSLDTSFSGDGKVITSISAESDYGRAMTIQPDGKIIVAGQVDDPVTHADFGVVRYNADGSLDTSFSGDGIVQTNIGYHDIPYGVAVQADGKIVVVGTNRLTIARYNSDGSLDTSFFGVGTEIIADINGNYLTCDGGVAIQADDKIVVAAGTQYDFAAVRLISTIPTPSGATFPVSDTGQTTCYDANGNILNPCPSSGESFYGQDACYTINPPSFTKLDASGNDLPDGAADWTMVRDNHTGLIWEVKTDDGGIHDKDNTYTWYDSNPATNGGDAGTPGDGTDTEDFINALNSQSFGGFSDWRMPTIAEIRSIFNYANWSPSVDTTYFKNCQTYPGAWHWTSTTHANTPSQVWEAGFVSGSIASGGDKQSDTLYIRAVRGQKASPSFTDNNDGTITDNNTGLMWVKEAGASTMNWESALAYCENLTLAGYSDWRLPTIKELASITDYSRYPVINSNFSYWPGGSYWSSTTLIDSLSRTEEAWLIAIVGYYNIMLKTNDSYYVRPVRGELSPPTDTDGDGVPDITDGCPNDPLKIAPGICGCGFPDTDTDNDGWLDCVDDCPNDPDKILPGVCGCGTPDTDTDGDGTPDCIDPVLLPPVADPGPDRTVDSDASVTLDGSGSYDPDGTLVSYLWEQTEGQEVVLTDATTPYAQFVSPTVAAGSILMTFSLTVTDNDGLSSSESVNVMVNASTSGEEPCKTSPQPISPADGTVDLSLMPVLVIDKDIDPVTCGTVHKTRWQISENPDFHGLAYNRNVFDGDLFSHQVPPGVLKPETTYYWHAHIHCSSGCTSGYSATSTFTTGQADNDTNGNGIPDNQEMTGQTDLDGDGQPDNQGEHFKGVITVVGNSYIAIATSENITSLQSLDNLDQDILDDMPDNMPWGLINFRIETANPGDMVQITIYFDEKAPAGSVYYKYDPIEGWIDYSQHATFAPNMKSVTIEIQDGGFGDLDGVANGVIVDPGGIGLIESGSGGGGGGSCFLDTVLKQ